MTGRFEGELTDSTENKTKYIVVDISTASTDQHKSILSVNVPETIA